MPALAVAEAYSEMAGPVDIRFFAAGEGTGHTHITRGGFPLDYVPGSPIARVRTLQQLIALGHAGLGVVSARALLAQHGARLAIGTGGYGSAGMLLAARSMGLMTALIEPNVVPGLANRILGCVVHRAMVAFEETAGAFPGHRAVITGVPVRLGFAQAGGSRRLPALPLVKLLVTSGSRGERFLGTHVPDLAARLQHEGLSLMVRHQGGDDASTIERAYADAGIKASVEPFIEDMHAALGWADFAIARAGAVTLAEFAIAGVPSLVVPLADAAHDHQAANAAAFVRRGAALSWREQDWNTDLVGQRVAGLIRNAQAWGAMSTAMSALAVPDAAARVVRECETLMEGRW